jgi:hypothetical protein
MRGYKDEIRKLNFKINNLEIISEADSVRKKVLIGVLKDLVSILKKSQDD